MVSHARRADHGRLQTFPLDYLAGGEFMCPTLLDLSGERSMIAAAQVAISASVGSNP